MTDAHDQSHQALPSTPALGPPTPPGPPAAPPGGAPASAPTLPGPPGHLPAAPQPPQSPQSLPPLLSWWPPVPGPAAPGVLWAGAAAGVAAAIALPWDRPGVGWLVVALVVTAAVGTLARRSTIATRTHHDGGDGERGHDGQDGPGGQDGQSRQRGQGIVRVAWAAGAVALTSVGTLRAAGWLFALCALAACVAGSLALTGGRSVRSILFGAVAVPAAAVRCPPWLTRGVVTSARTGGASGARLAGATLVGVVLVAVFGALFAGADATFARMLSDLLPSVGGESAFRWITLFGMVGLSTTGACYLLAAPVTVDPAVAGPRASLRRVEWAVPVGALVALFASFVLVQLVALFGGDAYVLRTAGLTYAQYARSGFWQLLVVTVLTLAVIAAAARWAPVATAADRAWLRGLLGALATLTLVVVASALTRIWSYQQAYGFTVLRLLVETCELWLGLVYLLVITAGVRLRGTWLPGVVVATGMAALLALAALNPDRFVAQRNIARWQQTGNIDVHYLSGLSGDAAPSLARLPEPLRSCALSALADRLGRHPDDWRAWNAGRSAARRVVATLGPPSAGDC